MLAFLRVAWALRPGPLPSLTGSEAWALGMYRVYTGGIEGAPFQGPTLRDHVTTLRGFGVRIGRVQGVWGLTACDHIGRIGVHRLEEGSFFPSPPKAERSANERIVLDLGVSRMSDPALSQLAARLRAPSDGGALRKSRSGIDFNQQFPMYTVPIEEFLKLQGLRAHEEQNLQAVCIS